MEVALRPVCHPEPVMTLEVSTIRDTISRTDDTHYEVEVPVRGMTDPAAGMKDTLCRTGFAATTVCKPGVVASPLRGAAEDGWRVTPSTPVRVVKHVLTNGRCAGDAVSAPPAAGAGQAAGGEREPVATRLATARSAGQAPRRSDLALWNPMPP